MGDEGCYCMGDVVVTGVEAEDGGMDVFDCQGMESAEGWRLVSGEMVSAEG